MYERRLYEYYIVRGSVVFPRLFRRERFEIRFPGRLFRIIRFFGINKRREILNILFLNCIPTYNT